jgi:hypothetical protein
VRSGPRLPLCSLTKLLGCVPPTLLSTLLLQEPQKILSDGQVRCTLLSGKSAFVRRYMQRIRLAVGCFFLIACLVSGLSFADDSQAVRVGVTVVGAASGITGVAGRDRLVKAFSKQKKSPVQAVPIDAAGDQVTAEAKAKNCTFVLFTTVTEAHNEGGASGKPGHPGIPHDCRIQVIPRLGCNRCRNRFSGCTRYRFTGGSCAAGTGPRRPQGC